MAETDVAITLADVQSLALKLRRLRTSLSAGEDQLLRGIITYGTQRRVHDVRGFADDPLPDFWDTTDDPNQEQLFWEFFDAFYAWWQDVTLV